MNTQTHTVFRDSFGNMFVFSKNSLDYPDYLFKVEQKEFKIMFEGTKKECLDYVILEEV